MGKKEYLVEGAKLICIRGSEPVELLIPEGHNYDSGGKKKANCCDCIKDKNIKCFGKCSKNTDNGLCEGFMELDDKWMNFGSFVNSYKKVNDNEAITMDSILFCRKGGVIIPLTSGQDFDSEVDLAAFMKRYLRVMKWAIGQNQFCHIFGADPVNLNTGNYVYDREDLYIRGIIPLSFKRYYNSLSDRADGVLGERWKHNYEIKLEFFCNKDLVNILLEDGRELKYRRRIDGKYESCFGEKEILYSLESGGYMYKIGERSYYFDGAGKIEKIEGAGAFISFFYNNREQLEKAQTNSGSYFLYHYSQAGRLIKVSDHTGRYIEFYYSYGKLVKFFTVMKTVYSYTYNEDGILQSITTPKGICALFNEYDGQGRVTKQYMADGNVIEFGYDDNNNRNYLKERNGSLTSYVGDEMLRNKETIYQDGKEEYAFNDNNKVTYYKDKNGNETYMEYDSRGNKTKVIDGMKNETYMSYDQENRMIKMVLPNGGIIENDFSADGKLVKLKGPLNQFQEIRYNGIGLPEITMDADNVTKEITYDQMGNIICIQEGSGGKTSYQYDRLNRVVQTIDGNSNVTGYRYNDNDDIIEVINAEGNKRSYQYDECGKVTELIDFDGTTIKREYDVCGRVSKEIHKSGTETKLKYDKAGNITEQELPNGAKTKYKYNHLGKICEIRDPLNHNTFYEYDGNGNLIKVINAKKEETTFTYDACNRISSKTEADGTSVIYEYNEIGQLIKMTYPTGVVLTRKYDEAGHVLEETDLYGNKIFYRYSDAGRLIERTDWAEGKIKYEYEQGLLVRIIYQNGCEEHFKYDGNKNIIEWKRKNGDSIYYQYDCMNRIKAVRNHVGTIRAFEYDAVGNVISMTDANGNQTKYEYSPMGSLIKVINADGSGMHYEYDDIEQIVSVYKMNGNESDNIKDMVRLYSYEYDLNGQVGVVTDALGNKEYYEYNELGKIQLKLDRDGYETRYDYGKNGQVSEIKYGDGRNVKLSYTPLRQLQIVEDWLGKTQFIRNSDNRLEKVVDFKGQAVGYQYGQKGECNVLIYPDGSKVFYEYDDFMRLKRLAFGEEYIHYTYTGDLLTKKKYSNGIESTYQYDFADRISSVTHTMEGKELETYQYRHDLFGNKLEEIRVRSGIPEDSGRYRYEYNSLNRLTGVYHDNDLVRAYEYDGYGNRTKKWEEGKETLYFYNAANQLLEERTSNDVIKYTYDQRGNMTEIRRNGEEEKKYEFNPMNQLGKAVDKRGIQAQYSYNGLGYRVEKTITGNEPVTVHYAVNQTQGYHNLLWKEENGKISKYIWGENIVGIERDGRDLFLLTDVAGSPIRSMNGLGNTEDVFAADEYGVLSSAGKAELCFAGYLADEISGTLYAQAREYMPQLGRFISEDKIGGSILFSASFNQYDYCWGNPIIFVDLTGLAADWLEKIIMGIRAHKAIEVYAEYGIDLEGGAVYTEVWIPYGLEIGNYTYYTPTGAGRADIVYVKGEGVKVYEIKPNTDYGRITGPIQIAAYYGALMTNEKLMKDYGYDRISKEEIITDKFNGIVNDLYNPLIQYKIYTDKKYGGIIFYEVIDNRPEKQNALSKAMANVMADEKIKESMQTFFEALVLGGCAGICYAVGVVLILDDATIVGVFDDAIAVAAITAGTYYLMKTLGKLASCVF